MIKNLTATLDLLTKNLTTVTEAYTSSGKGGDADKVNLDCSYSCFLFCFVFLTEITRV